MRRLTAARLLVAGLAAAAAVVAACGGIATASTSSSQGAGTSARAGNAVTGQLAQLSGSKLVISGQSGATNVTVSSATRITQLTTGTIADIASGQCITATGTKDATGAVTATSVALTPKPANRSCSQPANGSGAGNRPSPGSRPGSANRPRPSASPGAGGAVPRFSPPANFTAVRGEVSGVSGTSVTVKAASGGTQTVTVTSTTRVTRTIQSSTSKLAVGQCIRATGQKDSAGTVKATMLAITPAGPNGCTFAGAGGRLGGGFVGGGGSQQATQTNA